MTTNSIHNAFINALLADATYVDGLAVPGTDLAFALSPRLTPDLARYLADHFEVVTQKLTDDSVQSGFDATVWRGKDGGQVYISMRGSEGLGDFKADGDLSVAGLARRQVIDMVNWWLQGRAGEGSQAAQIKFEVVEDGEGFERETNNIIAAPTVAGNGKLSSVTSVIVNGHSLGDHLATAFTRLFGDSIADTTVRVPGNSFDHPGAEVFTVTGKRLVITQGSDAANETNVRNAA